MFKQAGQYMIRIFRKRPPDPDEIRAFDLVVPPYVRGQIDERAGWIAWGGLAIGFMPTWWGLEWLFRQSMIFEALLFYPLMFWFFGFFWLHEQINYWLYRRARRFRLKRGYWQALGPRHPDGS